MFWDLFGEQGHPVRATVSEMGPLLLSRLMDLNDVQEGVLNIAFRVADEQGLLLLDLKDLRAMLAYRGRAGGRAAPPIRQCLEGDRSAPSSASFWCWRTRAARNSSASRRSTLNDFMRTDRDGRGIINILAADKLMENPRLYATFLLWLLSELFEELPEVGDPDKPKLVFFFDEAHLLFNDAPKALLDKIEQVVRLIRSKGVGVYFVTQNPLDVPDTVLAQLGNRVQHALRAFTPRDQRAVQAAAETFRPNPEAQHRDRSSPSSARARRWCRSWRATARRRWSSAAWCGRRRRGSAPITPEERKAVIAKSPVKGKYDQPIDSEFRLRDACRSARSDPAQRSGRRRRRRAGRAGRRHRGGSAACWPAIGGVLGGIFGTNRAARPAAVDRPVDRARDHALGHQPGRRPGRRRPRQVDRRLDGRFGRPGHRARHAGRDFAAVDCRD